MVWKVAWAPGLWSKGQDEPFLAKPELRHVCLKKPLVALQLWQLSGMIDKRREGRGRKHKKTIENIRMQNERRRLGKLANLFGNRVKAFLPQPVKDRESVFERLPLKLALRCEPCQMLDHARHLIRWIVDENLGLLWHATLGRC